MSELIHWKKMANNSDYIGAYSFQPGEKKTVTITGVRNEMVHDPNGRSEEKTVVHLKEEKPLILNATNGKTISKVLGTPYIQQWVGKRIILGVEKVKAFGDVMDAVRVQKQVPPQIQQEEKFICEMCNKLVKPFGKMTAAQVVTSTKSRFGKCLCIECGQKLAEQNKAEQTKAEQAEQTEVQEGDAE